MLINSKALGSQLKKDLAPIYLVFGQEPLLVEESVDLIRKVAIERGYGDRTRFVVEPGFDWVELAHTSQTLSLFSQQRLLEIRLPSGRPGDRGGKALLEYASSPPSDTVLLLICGAIERRARTTKWFQGLDKTGVIVEHYEVGATKLLAWVQQRLRQQALRYHSGVPELLCHYFEGNLLALAQEVSKLKLLAGEAELSVDQVQSSISDNSRYNVYVWIDACLSGRSERSLRILTGLQAEGVEPVLIVWALAREIRNMVRICRRLAAGEPNAHVFKAHRIWSSRAGLVSAALKRIPPTQWLRLLSQVALADRVLKGRRPQSQYGTIWDQLEKIGLSLCGIKNLSEQSVYTVN